MGAELTLDQAADQFDASKKEDFKKLVKGFNEYLEKLIITGSNEIKIEYVKDDILFIYEKTLSNSKKFDEIFNFINNTKYESLLQFKIQDNEVKLLNASTSQITFFVNFDKLKEKILNLIKNNRLNVTNCKEYLLFKNKLNVCKSETCEKIKDVLTLLVSLSLIKKYQTFSKNNIDLNISDTKEQTINGITQLLGAIDEEKKETIKTFMNLVTEFTTAIPSKIYIEDSKKTIKLNMMINIKELHHHIERFGSSIVNHDTTNTEIFDEMIRTITTEYLLCVKLYNNIKTNLFFDETLLEENDLFKIVTFNEGYFEYEIKISE